MTRIVFFITFFGLFWVGLTQHSSFAAVSPYSVKGVEVDIIDESAVKARNKAFIEAQKKAFQVLATRFFSPENVKNIKTPSEEVLSSLIQDFKIASEQVSNKRYKGTFDFRFKSSAINQHFGHGPINLVNEKPEEIKKVLLLPFYNEEKKPVIFNKSQNPFWGSLIIDLEKYPNVILPVGNIQDLTDIGNKLPTNLSITNIRRLKARYETNLVMVAIANVKLANQKTIRVELADVSNGVFTPLVEFEADPKVIGIGTLAGVSELGRPQKNQDKGLTTGSEAPNEAKPKVEVPVSEINLKFLDPNSKQGKATLGGRERMIAMAQDRKEQMKLQASQQERLKAANGNEDSDSIENESGEVKVQVFFTEMSEWIKIQRELSALSGLRGIRIVTLSTNEANVVIEYNNWNKLLKSLQMALLRLEPISADSYILKRSSANF